MNKKRVINSRVLVTGGAGFIGSNLCDSFLDHGNEVICLDNFSTGHSRNIREALGRRNFKLIEGDIRDLAACKKAVNGVDYIFHQAAIGSVPRSIEDPISSHASNVTGFLNLLVAARDAKVRRVIYASSSAVYGDSPDLPKREEQIGKPLSPYAANKLFNEHYAHCFSTLYGTELIGLRYFNVFGQRQDPDGAYAAVIPKFVKALIAGERPVICGDGSQTRDFTFIDNVVSANHLAALCSEESSTNTVYNVACGGASSLNELFSLLIRLMSRMDGRISEIQPVYDSPRIGDIKHSLASIEKATRLLGYSPAFDLEQGLAQSIDWYWTNLSENRK